jgi:hypothetical protein
MSGDEDAQQQAYFGLFGPYLTTTAVMRPSGVMGCASPRFSVDRTSMRLMAMRSAATMTPVAYPPSMMG